MATVENRQVVLERYIEGVPKVTDMAMKIGKIELKAPKGSGAFLVKNLYLSCDPYMRGRMRDFHGSYVPPFVPSQPIEGFGVGKVLDSDHPDFKPGDFISGITGWEEYSLIHNTSQLRKIHKLILSLPLRQQTPKKPAHIPSLLPLHCCIIDITTSSGSLFSKPKQSKAIVSPSPTSSLHSSSSFTTLSSNISILFEFVCFSVCLFFSSLLSTMGSSIYGVSSSHISLFLFFSFLSLSTAALPQNPSGKSSPSGQINSNSVLVALLDSHYTELAELVEKALLLQTLEEAVGKHNITIFAPRNEALERQLDPEFKRFLLEPGNLKSLQTLLMFHIIPKRVGSHQWPDPKTGPVKHNTLCNDHIRLSSQSTGEKTVDSAELIRPDDVIRPDGVIHGIQQLLIPRSVIEDFNRRRNLRSITAVLPEGAPEVDPRTHRLKKPAPVPVGAPPVLPIYDAMAPGPSLAPAPAPGPGGPRHHFDGESQVKDFIQTLLHYGGYNEMADILVNLTSLATEMGRLVSEGYVITVLAPNDEAMAKLTTDQLSEPGAPEQIIYYHIIPEYQTEESMYNAVRRFGKVKYDTLRLPHKVVAQEADGSVKFGHGEGSAYLFDPDIYTDGRISVQGIDGVLFPEEETQTVKKPAAVKVASKPRRGKLLEVGCWMLGSLGGGSGFRWCQ